MNKSIVLLLLVAAFLTVCFTGCKSQESPPKPESGLSSTDTIILESKIRVHNAIVKRDFANDSISEAARQRAMYSGYAKKEAREYIDAYMAAYYDKWNKPYAIQKDKELTLEKYMEYCKAHNYDPKTYIKYLE